ncbi:AHL_G0047870.mRNA.1.CDS.1 [Saccharomyces cerevisiae]|nr:AHL_G0047870.mRNA.1.CDS.1 [Saccharomyces cerevisiae]CAI6872153.1 AHL_G0047870.mRNA.1.CDS.1 [Saccharomyces cerevisiae]
MKVSDRRKFEKANFDEFESALNNKNDLVHCPSITLFESIPTEVRSFYEDEKSGLIKVVKFRTGAMDRKRSFEKIVISVMVGKNVQKFLTFVEDEPDFQGGPIPSKTSATTTESTNSSTNATTTASTNVRTSATTTASINVRTSATTTESTNSNTSATTTESTDSNTSATTTESTDSNTSATTTASTNSSTNATTTASTNSSTNATTTESTNASAKEDANKDGNAEDNRFHPVTDINKEPYKRKGSQMVLLERKKLKAQFPNTSENMNVLQFLGFRSDEIKHLFLYGIDIYFCPEGVFTQYGLCKGCQKMFELCVCWAGQKVSYRRMAWEALAVERMLRNDEEYKEYLEDIEPYHGDPVGYLKYFSVKRGEIYSQIQRNYAWYLAITRRRETISVLDSTRGKQGSQVFRMSGRQIKELYYKVWSNLRESKTEVLQYFLNWDEKKCREEWEAKDDTVFVEALEKVGVFQRLRSMTSAGLQGPQYVKLQFSRHHRQLRSRYELSLGMHLRDQLALGVTPSKVPHWTAFLSMLIGLFCNKTFRQKLEYLLEQISEVWLLPHWVDLANVEVLAADNTRVPLYMLMVAVHKELDSDDVPDGRFDIILLCRDSSREVGE